MESAIYSSSAIRHLPPILNGWIILDKPSGITSAHAVAKVKRLLRPVKIGHAGTLDPLASGVLPLAIGEATKTVSYMMDAAKAYSFTVTWGQERATDDSAGKVLAESKNLPAAQDILNILPEFTGDILQSPPNYSAIKLNGKRAYDMARNGEEVEIKPRNVRVDSLELVSSISVSSQLSSDFICHCGKGTYIRSLARDMGRVLGCYGHISRLRRLKVGKFTESNAISLENLADMVHKGVVDFLQPVESALDDILAWEINSIQATCLRHGQTIDIPDIYSGNGAELTVLAQSDGKAVAICRYEAGMMKPLRVFNI